MREKIKGDGCTRSRREIGREKEKEQVNLTRPGTPQGIRRNGMTGRA